MQHSAKVDHEIERTDAFQDNVEKFPYDRLYKYHFKVKEYDNVNSTEGSQPEKCKHFGE